MSKCAIVVLAMPAICCAAASTGEQFPTATLRNGQLTATVALPDARKGYYRGTRFDWSGIVSSLRYKGHEFITPWSQASEPDVLDFEYRGDQIVTGPTTTMVGMPEEFSSLPARTAHGWEEAAIDGTFIKIGVGVLRKPDDKPYDHFRSYELVSDGDWQVKKTATSVTFLQTIDDPDSGYGYSYTKTVAVASGKAQLTITHSLRNTGSKALQGMVYDHNFIRWDNESPGPDYSMHFAFEPKPSEPLGETPLVFNGHTVNFTRALTGKESIRVLPVGFGGDPKDYDFSFENRKLGIGLRVTANRPLARATIWGIRSVFAIEPFINYDIPPGSEFRWIYTYQAYDVNKGR